MDLLWPRNPCIPTNFLSRCLKKIQLVTLSHPNPFELFYLLLIDFTCCHWKTNFSQKALLGLGASIGEHKLMFTYSSGFEPANIPSSVQVCGNCHSHQEEEHIHPHSCEKYSKIQNVFSFHLACAYLNRFVVLLRRSSNDSRWHRTSTSTGCNYLAKKVPCLINMHIMLACCRLSTMGAWRKLPIKNPFHHRIPHHHHPVLHCTQRHSGFNRLEWRHKGEKRRSWHTYIWTRWRRLFSMAPTLSIPGRGCQCCN